MDPKLFYESEMKQLVESGWSEACYLPEDQKKRSFEPKRTTKPTKFNVSRAWPKVSKTPLTIPLPVAPSTSKVRLKFEETRLKLASALNHQRRISMIIHDALTRRSPWTRVRMVEEDIEVLFRNMEEGATSMDDEIKRQGKAMPSIDDLLQDELEAAMKNLNREELEVEIKQQAENDASVNSCSLWEILEDMENIEGSATDLSPNDSDSSSAGTVTNG